MRDCTGELTLDDSEFFEGVELKSLELDKGRAVYAFKEKEGLFYRALKDECGVDINDEFDLMASLGELVKAKRSFDKMSKALQDVAETGYGVVTPTMDEMTLASRRIFKQGALRRQAQSVRAKPAYYARRYRNGGVSRSRYGAAKRGSCKLLAVRVRAEPEGNLADEYVRQIARQSCQ